MPVGTVIVYRRVEAGKDPYLNRMTVVWPPTMRQARSPTRSSMRRERCHGGGAANDRRWEDLRKHAEFPVAAVQTSDDAVDVPAGHFDTWKYVVTDPDGTVSTYQFARTLPGPPVWMEIRNQGAVVFSMALVSRTGC
jgi:hypothetical protein